MDLFQQNTVFQFLFLGLLLFIKEHSCACNLTEVNQCTAILSRVANSNVTVEGISAIPDVDQLTKICGAMPSFKACYEPKSRDCTKDLGFSMTFGTIENTIDYLCVDGYDAIIQHATCWNQTGVTADTTYCHMKQNMMISELHSQQMLGNLNPTTVRTLWCQILDNTTTCMQNAVSARCGEVPACIMRTMMTRALKGLAGLMKCPAPVPCNFETHANGSTHTDGAVHSNGTAHADDTAHSDGAVHPDGTAHADDTAHSDGTVHSDGDQHSDHSNDHAHAHPEISSDPKNGANTASLRLFTCFLSLYLSCNAFF